MTKEWANTQLVCLKSSEMLYLIFVDQIFRKTNASSEHFRSHSRTGRQVEAWQNENMKEKKNEADKEKMKGKQDLMNKLEDGEVDGEQVHTLGWQVILPSSVKKSRRGRRWGPSPIWSEPKFLVRAEEEKLQGELKKKRKSLLWYTHCF